MFVPSTIVTLWRPSTSIVSTGEEGGRVLVDADAEQSRAARHQRQQAADAIALAEMLVDDHARHETEPGRHLRHAHAR